MRHWLLAAAIAIAIACGAAPEHPVAPPASTEATHELAPAPADPISSAPIEVQQWVAEHALPIATIEAGHGFADLEPLRAVVGDARIVALGESTHGTREFFQLKHRMLEFLVTQMGFTVFAIEASMPEAYAIDDYVVHGKGDAETALAGTYFWTWNTEEVLALIEWMRAYNADGAHTNKVRFYGFDMQYAPVAAAGVLAYLRRVDPRAATAAGRRLAPLLDAFAIELGVAQSQPEWPRCAAEVESLSQRFDAQRRRWVDEVDRESFEIARQHLRVLEQYLSLYSVDTDGSDIRDAAMAANVDWILARDPERKVVLWAHNAHVETTAESMGAHLRRTHGDELRVFGFAFHRGSFAARDRDSPMRTVRAFTVGAAHDDSTEALLASTGHNALALDLRAIPDDGPIHTWFGEPTPTRSVGAVFLDGADPFYYERRVMPERYDALLFVADTTASHPTRSAGRDAIELHAAATNLDFELDADGPTPSGWNVRPPEGFAGFEVTLDDDHPHSGKRCAKLSRSRGSAIVGTYGRMVQELAPGSFAGKTLVLRAAVRTDASGIGNRVYLFVKAQRKRQSMYPPAEAHARITGDAWHAAAVELAIPADADRITLGVALVGEGQVWLDDVRIDTEMR